GGVCGGRDFPAGGQRPPVVPASARCGGSWFAQRCSTLVGADSGGPAWSIYSPAGDCRRPGARGVYRVDVGLFAADVAGDGGYGGGGWLGAVGWGARG